MTERVDHHSSLQLCHLFHYEAEAPIIIILFISEQSLIILIIVLVYNLLHLEFHGDVGVIASCPEGAHTEMYPLLQRVVFLNQYLLEPFYFLESQ